MFAHEERHPHLLKLLLVQCLLSTQRAHLHFPHQLFQGSTELSLAARQPRLHGHHSQPATSPAAQAVPPSSSCHFTPLVGRLPTARAPRHPRPCFQYHPASPPLQIHQLSQEKQRWIAQCAHCLPKARFPPPLYFVCAYKAKAKFVHAHTCCHVQFSWVTCTVSICGAGAPKNAWLVWLSAWLWD